MYNNLLDIVLCPACRKRLDLTSFENGETVNGQITADAKGPELISGVLKCGCGVLYPIIDGVPRLLEGGIKHFPGFLDRYRQEITRLSNGQEFQIKPEAATADNDFENIRKSFSQEWGEGVFDYENFNTWGWTLEERKQVVLGELRMSPKELAGKLMLDAGCGNGTLSAALADLGLTIVGLDLNDGLGMAYRNRVKCSTKAKAAVQYIQGNVVYPPLNDGQFDVVYSSGVIHHTPSSKTAFDTLVRMTKKGGRLFIWVYGKRALPVRLFHLGGESLKCCLSLKSLLRVCRLLAPFYKMAASMLNMLRIMRFRSRTTREVTLDLFDAFAPRFNHWHTEAEVRSWFEQHGFKNITLTSHVRQGFGMYGDKN